MAAQIVVIYIYIYKILVIFDNPDGSTSRGHINYNILVQSDSPDGSTNWDNILVQSDSPDELVLNLN